MPSNPLEIMDEWKRVVGRLEAARFASAGGGDASDGPPQVPVTVLTGPLGAGKTTILRELLRNSGGQRISVVVNDVAAMAFDADQIAAVQPRAASGSLSSLVSLTNGCSCCSLLGDVVTTLSGLAAEKPDAIVVELSGVSDAATIAEVVDGHPAVRLDGVVTVIDASTAGEHLDDPRIAPVMRRQLEAAHIVILSKSDLLKRPVDDVRDRLSSLVPGRRIVAARYGDVDPVVLLSAADHGARLAPTSDRVRLSTAQKVVVLDAMTAHDLGRWLDRLPSEVLRVKGYASVLDGQEPGDRRTRTVEVQAVGCRWTLTESELREPGLTVITSA